MTPLEKAKNLLDASMNKSLSAQEKTDLKFKADTLIFVSIAESLEVLAKYSEAKYNQEIL